MKLEVKIILFFLFPLLLTVTIAYIGYIQLWFHPIAGVAFFAGSLFGFFVKQEEAKKQEAAAALGSLISFGIISTVISGLGVNAFPTTREGFSNLLRGYSSYTLLLSFILLGVGIFYSVWLRESTRPQST